MPFDARQHFSDLARDYIRAAAIAEVHSLLTPEQIVNLKKRAIEFQIAAERQFVHRECTD